MTPEQYAEREFKTSESSTFAANIAFEIYRPTTPTTTSARPQRKRRLMDSDDDFHRKDNAPDSTPQGLVRLLVNEVPMLLPGCGEDIFCEWSTFKKALQLAGTGCDFDGCCTTLKPDPAPGPDPDPEQKPELEPSAATVVKAEQLVFLKKKAHPACLAVEPIVA